MLCEICRRQRALETRRMDRGYGEEKVAVCESCAKRMDNEQANISFSEFFWGQERRITKCAVCGTDINEIKRTKYVGCAECYKVFADTIKELTSSIHGRNEHVGRMPQSISNNLDKFESPAKIMGKALETGNYDLANYARNHFPGRREG